MLVGLALNTETKMAIKGEIRIPFINDDQEVQDETTKAIHRVNIAEGCKTSRRGAVEDPVLRTQLKKKRREKKKMAAAARKAKKKNLRLTEKRTEVEKQITAMISVVQADMQNLIEAEKRKSEQYRSLARKYYTMWKALNDQTRRLQSMSKEERGLRENDSSIVVPVLKDENFSFCLPKTKMTMNKRFAKNASSEGKNRILRETLNISCSI